MLDLFKFFSGDSTPYHPPVSPEYNCRLCSANLKQVFSCCGDFQFREIDFALEGKQSVFICWIDGLISGSELSEDILRPLTDLSRGKSLRTERDIISAVKSGLVYSCAMSERTTMDELVSDLNHGCCALVFDLSATALCFEVKSDKTRGITEPSLEKSLKAAKDSFVETLRTNTALVRRRISSPRLKIVESTLGRKSHTKIALTFVEGIADPETLDELSRRLDELDVDALISTGGLEEYIVDDPLSPFPQLLHTERPDRLAQYLLEGRIGLLVDGISIALVLPATFADFMRVTSDGNMNYLVAGALRVVRYFALVLSATLPALYVAIAMYHQEMLPTKLLLSVIQAKQDVPFSTGLEIFGMLVAFALLQEAGLRLPSPIGDTVSIIGALIVGQAAVDARLVSPIAIIVVAASGIAGYALPSHDMSSAVNLIRIILLFMSMLAGLYGVGLGLCLLILYLADMSSFGISYTAPVSEKGGFAFLSLLFLKPKPMVKQRSDILNTPDRRRQK